ncbi:MAG: M48 family metalloprotease [Deltaproteobacteria bacterium]|nr:M48 family metalloprotease [Deltaproteobacteria bacterium]
MELRCSGMDSMHNVKNNTFLLLVAALFVAQCATNPVTGEKELILVSEHKEIQIGQQNYGPTIQSFDGLYRYDEGQDYINRIGQKLAALSHRPGLEYEFKVVNTPMVNAFALPGGKICITRGMLSHLKNEAQLAAVLGHEIGHVTARHTAKAMTRQMIFGGLVALGAYATASKYQQYGDLIMVASGLGLNAFLAKYSRDQETQSDELGLNYMTKAGYNPQGAVEMFQLLQSLQKTEPGFLEAMFMSHPQSKDRVAHAKALIAMEYARVSKQKGLTYETSKFKTVAEKLKAEESFYKEHEAGVKAAEKSLWNEAVTHFNKAIEGKPNEALFHADLGYALLLKGDQQTSQTHLQKAIELYPEFFKPNYYMGYLQYKQYNYGTALSYLKQADKLVGGNPEIRLMIGESYEHSGDVRSAVEYYVDVYQTAPQGKAGQIAEKHLLRLGVLKPQPQPQRQ